MKIVHHPDSATLVSYAAGNLDEGFATLVAADVAQWITEAGGHHVGLRDPRQRKRAGRVVGFTTALGVGAIAGPTGVAFAGGVWAVSELVAEASRQAIDHTTKRYPNLPPDGQSA